MLFANLRGINKQRWEKRVACLDAEKSLQASPPTAMGKSHDYWLSEFLLWATSSRMIIRRLCRDPHCQGMISIQKKVRRAGKNDIELRG
jgi:hypothetical protein